MTWRRSAESDRGGSIAGAARGVLFSTAVRLAIARMLGRSAGGEIAVAFALVFTQGADALHVVQHQWFDAREIVAVDAEGVEQFRQFIRSMRPETNQFIQIGGGNPQIGCDAVKLTC